MKPILMGGLILLLVVLLSPINSDAVCVNVSTANLRNGPGKGYDVTWKVYRYMPLQKVGVSLSNDWYAVKDVDGEVAWIHESLVSSRSRCAVVKTDTAKIRTGPGLSYSPKFAEPAVKYESFKVVKLKDNWVKLEDAGKNVGWIYRNLLWMK